MLVQVQLLKKIKHSLRYYTSLIITPSFSWFGLFQLLSIIGTAILAFFAPIVWFVIAVLFAILADTITGVWAANKKKIKILSGNFYNCIIKFGSYFALIIMAYVIQILIISNVVPLVTIITGVILLVEGFSIAENVDVITGNKIFGTIFKKWLNSFVSAKLDKDIFGNKIPKEEEDENINNGTGTTATTGTEIKA